MRPTALIPILVVTACAGGADGTRSTVIVNATVLDGTGAPPRPTSVRIAGDRIAVRFAYEYHDDPGNWFRAYGNENWEFDAHGLMRRRFASINDLPIREADRKYHWDRSCPRPMDHPRLSDLGL